MNQSELKFIAAQKAFFLYNYTIIHIYIIRTITN